MSITLLIFLTMTMKLTFEYVTLVSLIAPSVLATPAVIPANEQQNVPAKVQNDGDIADAADLLKDINVNKAVDAKDSKPANKNVAEDDVQEVFKEAEKKASGNKNDKKGKNEATKEKAKVEKEKVPSDLLPMPSQLTMEDFDKETSRQLSFVEFYSPYCSHCKALAPVWEKAYREFHEDMKKLNIQMRQINCVESGDLCEREEIQFYPNLKLYAPLKDPKTGELIPGKSKNVDAYPRSLSRTAENFKKYMRNAVAEYNSGNIDIPSSSQLIGADEMLKIIAGDIEEPHFITFFPSTDHEWASSESTGKNKFSKTCPDCVDIKNVWDKLSNHILSVSRAGHFNCQTNPSICKSLEMPELTRPGTRSLPKFVMFLPKSVGKIRFDYKDEIDLDKMKAFANRLFENSQFETLSARGITEVMDFVKNLPGEPLDTYYPLNNVVSMVYFFDEKSVTEEDKAILPHLLEFVTNSPFNVHLYTGKHEKIEKNVQTQAESLVDFIHYNKKEPKREFNKAMYLATTLTSKPTLLVFKDRALMTTVYQSFAPEDIRNSKKLEKFVAENQFPLFNELTSELIPHYFNSDIEEKGDKVVVAFIDSSNEKETSEAFYNISLAAHEYYYLKKEYYFNDVIKKREAKDDRVAKLKQSNADSVRVIKELREEVPHLFTNSEVLFTFIDVAKQDKIRSSQWKINTSKFQAGDAIVISRDNRYYWDQNVGGNQLTNDPYTLKPLLLSLLDSSLVENSKAVTKLVGSPYGGVLRFMDRVHDKGLMGYITLAVAVYIVVFAIRKLSKKRRLTKGGRQSVGIIGNNMPKND
ncbi:uncharacterized protein RJT20DRAFT_147813 [Scheffersomyces xylosifermentans]|uniref:uncharacterized protein n=1 Tax=Scheffersomyces xylosifermentans TaxID=1304137 RepID=UPI00315D8545